MAHYKHLYHFVKGLLLIYSQIVIFYVVKSRPFKPTSYPRTDCAYLPESQHADAPRVLEAIKHVNPELAGLVDGADPRIKSKTWDDSKITAHHGIVPTMQKGIRRCRDDQAAHVELQHRHCRRWHQVAGGGHRPRARIATSDDARRRRPSPGLTMAAALPWISHRHFWR